MLNSRRNVEPDWAADIEQGKEKGQGNPGTPPQADIPLANNVPQDSAEGSKESTMGFTVNEQSMVTDLETAILLQVTTMFLTDPPTRIAFIEVNNDQGVITLRGQVTSAEMSARVGEIASRYPGVTGVINALEIRSGEQPGII